MARMNSLNNLIYLIFFSVLHLTKASKPSIKTVTVNPCTFTPTTPTYVSPSSPCPTITISTSHTSCPPSLAPVPTPYQPPPSTPRAPRPVRKPATSAIKSTTKHPAPPPSLTPPLPAQPQLPSSTPQLPSQYQRVARHFVPAPTILPTLLIAIRPVQFIPLPRPLP
ncbi:hypothetical protein BofuT4_P075860.1 [Botrytis cinerea T4]|uniref:Uncharacterized protein n=1 Tax=Botryotinia fuckeliana (strain T4) TaxID=999810 RepID=G2XNP7_BOTF4|nr:hypothetical protein BofuT4_P075860.1 [Botrytis cinerea T4]